MEVLLVNKPRKHLVQYATLSSEKRDTAYYLLLILLVTLARRAYDNAQHWTRAHHTRFEQPHPEDLATTGCYDIDTAEQRVIIL